MSTKKKHAMFELIDKVDETHPGLGELAALECLVIKCRKLLMVVAPAGTGKSKVSQYVGLQAHSSLLTDRLSVAGLAQMTEQFNNFEGVVVVDDIAKTQTDYARVSTVTALAELVYSHYISSHMSKLQFEIRDFNGSAIVNVQPTILKKLVASPEWEASIQDKAIRYYHLKRPIEPVDELPKHKIHWGIDLEKVDAPKMDGELGLEVLAAAKGQWGRARTIEHTTALVRAASALDRRRKVNTQDYRLVSKLLKPLRYEQLVLVKKDFEAQRELADHRLALLTEFVSYGEVTVDLIAEDYHMSVAQAYKLMSKYSADWQIISRSPTRYAPSKDLVGELEQLGLISEDGKSPKKGLDK